MGTFVDLTADCPATFDGTLDSFPPCLSNGLAHITYRCGDVRALSISGGYAGSTCYYDSSNHQLVGAEVFSDIPQFCGQTSFTEIAGRTAPESCPATDDRVEQTCEAPSPPAGGA